MCEWVDANQRALGAAVALASARKRAARYIAICLGCRCSEYLGPDIHWEKIILVPCVRPMKGGACCNWEDDFDGAMVTFRGSKTDQFNLGCKRYVGKAGNSKCAIAAFHEWVELQLMALHRAGNIAPPRWWLLPTLPYSPPHANRRGVQLKCGNMEQQRGTP